MDYKNGDHIWISTSGRSRQAKFIRYHGEQCIVEMTVRVTTSLYIFIGDKSLVMIKPNNHYSVENL